jgi:type II secretion system protein J
MILFRAKLREAAAFTLIELMLALVIFAIILSAINAVFFSAMHLRNKSADAVEQSIPIQQAYDTIRRDLQGIVLPGGTLAGSLQTGVSSNLVQDGSTQFTTSTGSLSDYEPWGKLQRVTYTLRNPMVRTSIGGKDLIRSVTRNLLATTQDQPYEQLLLTDALQVQLMFYDGIQWRNYWDSTTETSSLPKGIRIEVDFAPDFERRTNIALQVTVPILPQAITNTTAATTTVAAQ